MPSINHTIVSGLIKVTLVDISAPWCHLHLRFYILLFDILRKGRDFYKRPFDQPAYDSNAPNLEFQLEQAKMQNVYIDLASFVILVNEDYETKREEKVLNSVNKRVKLNSSLITLFSRLYLILAVPLD